MSKALELAKYLQAQWYACPAIFTLHRDTIDELRRLDALNAELVEALNLCYDHLRLYRPEVESNNVGSAVQAVIAKAKEQS